MFADDETVDQEDVFEPAPTDAAGDDEPQVIPATEIAEVEESGVTDAIEQQVNEPHRVEVDDAGYSTTFYPENEEDEDFVVVRKADPNDFEAVLAEYEDESDLIK